MKNSTLALALSFVFLGVACVGTSLLITSIELLGVGELFTIFGVIWYLSETREVK